MIQKLEREAPRGEKVAETAHFEFYAEGGYFPVPIDAFAQQAETVFDYVSRRLGVPFKGGKIYLSFQKPPVEPCPPRGATVQPSFHIVIYADESTPNKQLLGVLAHEIGHALHWSNFGSPDDAILNEGLATWAAGHYWLQWQEISSFDEAVRLYLKESRFIPLPDYDPRMEKFRGEDCLFFRDIVYTERASFIGFLIRRYGMKKLQMLLETVPPPEFTERGIIIRPPDYYGVYGKSLEELEMSWVRSLSNTN